MKTMIALLILLAVSFQGHALEVKTGDMLFLSLPCYACRVIEGETQSEYSHVGVIVQSPEGEYFVAEAWGKVKLTPVDEFLARRTKGSTPGHYRVLGESFDGPMVWERFKNFFEGADYDSAFLWDNVDGLGKERFYCSELVAKLLAPWLSEPFEPSPMNFDRHWDFWVTYFRGEENIPQGLPGISPQALIDHPSTFVP